MHVDLAIAISFLSSAFYLDSHYQKDMVSLRVLALASNILILIFDLLHARFDM